MKQKAAKKSKLVSFSGGYATRASFGLHSDVHQHPHSVFGLEDFDENLP